MTKSIPSPGSPPHTRGKAVNNRRRQSDHKDHPRTRGEKALPWIMTVMTLGSPPHTRGKVYITVYGFCRDLKPGGKSFYRQLLAAQASEQEFKGTFVSSGVHFFLPDIRDIWSGLFFNHNYTIRPGHTYVSVKKSTEIPSLHRKDIVNLPSVPKVTPQMIGNTNIIHDRTVFSMCLHKKSC